MVVTLAIMIVAFGEVQFTILGVCFCVASVVFRAVKAQLQALLMAPGALSQTFDPLELTLWTAVQTFIIMMGWSLVSEGLAPWQNFFIIGAYWYNRVDAQLKADSKLAEQGLASKEVK